MYELDKKRFASFISTLRKEKSFTQRELAEKLFVSDKAVSKWETGVSIPDTDLLVPLAEVLGVNVTELLMCESQTDASLSAGEVEDVVKTKLPDCYDSNRIGAYNDGPVRMNVPGVIFNNNNWPHIVRVGRIWSCAAMVAYPLICVVLAQLMKEYWQQVELYVLLALLLGGLFLPIYIVGKKYQ